MPGLVGSVCKKFDLDKVLALIRHTDCQIIQGLFVDKYVTAGQVAHDLFANDISHTNATEDIAVWLDGEFFNGAVLLGEDIPYNPKQCSLQLKRLIKQCPELSFLNQLNGFFSIVVYFKKQHKIMMISDFMGLKPLYYKHTNEGIVWSSELKCFPVILGEKMKWNRVAVQRFIETGNLHADESFFQGVQLTLPGEILEYDITSNRLSRRAYWNAEDYISKTQKNKKSIVKEGVNLLKAAIKTQTQDYPKLAIFLSGGLDSRAIFAGIPNDYPNATKAITFGQKNAQDIQIAKQVSIKSSISHDVYSLPVSNFLERHKEAIWWNDAGTSCIHQHEVALYPEFNICDHIYLSGFLGDALLGGSYITNNSKAMMWQNYLNRGRRFILEGTLLRENFLPIRPVFMDKLLVEFSLSLDLSMLKNWDC